MAITDPKKLVFSLAVCLLAGFIGSVFTTPAITTWYSTLIKPAFNPPNWLFGPVWTSLYILIGISFYLVLVSKKKNKEKSIILFWAQLGLNSLWSIIFFGLKNPLYAFIEIIVLWITILLTILEFYKTSKTSAYLLLPYIVWVSFASVLNLAIVLLN